MSASVYIGVSVAIICVVIFLWHMYNKIYTEPKKIKKKTKTRPIFEDIISDEFSAIDTPSNEPSNEPLNGPSAKHLNYSLDLDEPNKPADCPTQNTNVVMNSKPPELFDYMRPSITQITDNVFLSDCSVSFNHKKINELGITHMLVIGDTLKIHDEDKYSVLHIKIDDTADAKLKPHYDECYNFIADNKTLVYCVNGISRSATVVVSYLMKKYKISAKNAIEHVKLYRPIICVEDHFLKELQRLECEMNP